MNDSNSVRGVSRNESAQIELPLCGTQLGPATTARRRQCRKTVCREERPFGRLGGLLTSTDGRTQAANWHEHDWGHLRIRATLLIDKSMVDVVYVVATRPTIS